MSLTGRVMLSRESFEEDSKDFDNLLPQDKYWSENLYKDFHLEGDLPNYHSKLNPIEAKTLQLIENIYGFVCFGMNFSCKKVGFDEITKHYLADVNSISENSNKNDNILNINRSLHEFYGKQIVGVDSFVRCPGGVIEFHKSNAILFNLSAIALMLTKASFPIEFVDELSRGDLMTFKRSNGDLQKCVFNRNSSITWSKNKSLDDGYNWRVQASFNDIKNMNAEEIDKSSISLLNNNYGGLEKLVYLKEIMELNNIEILTINATCFKAGLKSGILELDNLQIYGSDSEDDDENNEKIRNEVPMEKLFISLNNEPDIIFNNYQDLIIENVAKYFESRFDKYIKSVYKSMTDTGISVKIV